MALAKQIRTQINKLPEGKTFGYADLAIAKTDYTTAAKAIERLQKTGLIKKVSKGVFYKPKQTIFGELKPDYFELLRPYLFEKGKRIAYITGTFLYNRMNLTTQMAFRIRIASRVKRISINRGALKAVAVKSYTEVTDANYDLLGFLDAFKDFKKIPDTSNRDVIKILNSKIKNLTKLQIDNLIKYALLYPPRVRALVGAVLQNINSKTDILKLKQSLNPLTKFKFGLNESDLPTIKSWNIE